MTSKPLDPLSAPSDTDPRIHAELVVRYRQMSHQAKLGPGYRGTLMLSEPLQKRPS